MGLQADIHLQIKIVTLINKTETSPKEIKNLY